MYRVIALILRFIRDLKESLKFNHFEKSDTDNNNNFPHNFSNNLKIVRISLLKMIQLHNFL